MRSIRGKTVEFNQHFLRHKVIKNVVKRFLGVFVWLKINRRNFLILVNSDKVYEFLSLCELNPSFYVYKIAFYFHGINTFVELNSFTRQEAAADCFCHR